MARVLKAALQGRRSPTALVRLNGKAPQGLVTCGGRSFKGYTECTMQTASQRRYSAVNALLRLGMMFVAPQKSGRPVESPVIRGMSADYLSNP
jgi:hypothetical protein